jgi:hypothetical protein
LDPSSNSAICEPDKLLVTEPVNAAVVDSNNSQNRSIGLDPGGNAEVLITDQPRLTLQINNNPAVKKTSQNRFLKALKNLRLRQMPKALRRLLCLWMRTRVKAVALGFKTLLR